ncbi:hypothetical protein AB1Y20_004900 [Prymnesium parvum]|uniref:Protein-tyrosine sulfotransferase n=1 Tax=Prymnesium parvum TaxID=97485 RepID=A0AB34J1J8_PRYPA
MAPSASTAAEPSLVSPPSRPTISPRAVLIHAHGRSGSTLLLDILRHDPQAWASYEPLQEVRQLPPPHLLPPHLAGRCRDGAAEQPTLASKCPHRDASLLLSLLACDSLPLLAAWYAEYDLSAAAGGYLPHAAAYGAAFTLTSDRPALAAERAALYARDASACAGASLRVVKTIRLNGQLARLYNLSASPPPLVLHLVRDLKSVYLSRKALAAPFGLPSAASLEAWARAMCAATRRDMAAGARRPRGQYELLNFTHLVRFPRSTVERIYRRHLRRPVPPAVRAYLEAHFEPPANGTDATAWQFQFGTAPRDVEALSHAWRLRLDEWEVRAINAGCARERAGRHAGLA